MSSVPRPVLSTSMDLWRSLDVQQWSFSPPYKVRNVQGVVTVSQVIPLTSVILTICLWFP